MVVHSVNNTAHPLTKAECESWRPLECRLWPSSGVRSLGYARGLMGELSAAAAANGPTVISQHGLWLYYGSVSRRIGGRAGAPVLVHPHGMLEPWALNRSAWKKKIVGALWEHGNLRRARCIRVTAPTELESVRGFGLKNPVALIPNGVDVDDFARLPGPATLGELGRELEGRRAVLFLSRVHPKKGLPLLLKAWSRLSRAREGWALVIAGPDEVGHTRRLKELASSLGVERSVIFCGPLYGERKLAALSLAELLVLPAYSENFGVVVAEALAAGLPVLTTRGTPWKDLVGKGCGWHVETTEKALGEALREALGLPPPALRRMGARGREWMARDYSWSVIGEQMFKVCEWMHGGGAPPPCVVT